jgi:hypothetical protein
MSFKDFQPVTLRGSQAWADTRKTMPKIPFAASAMVFGHPQVQHHDLIALACMFEHAFVRCFDTKAALLTVQTIGSILWLCPDVDLLASINPFYD